jgi:hypothetical protein
MVAINIILIKPLFRNFLAITVQPKFPIIRTMKVALVQDSAKPKLRALKNEYRIPGIKKTSENPRVVLYG